jgi:serine/threonine protein kinase
VVAANQQIGRYTLLRRLASGGMGEVYLAKSAGAANFSKQVAIKCILPHLAQNQDFVQKFIDEANLMVQLHHGSIVPVIELFQENLQFYLVMEYVPGRDLKSVLRTLKRKKIFMPASVALWVVKLLCEALGYAHHKTDSNGDSLNIIHRDVSPSNVILGAAGEVKLLDFGIAKARSRVHQSISGTLQGKFVYMSPEIADGKEVDLRTDLFSLGLVLYELLTHTRPLDGDSETIILRNARECEILPPSIEHPEVTTRLDRLVMKALAKDPNERYDDAFAFGRAINEYLVEQNLHPSSNELAEFLKALFPEGVVDESDREIQSIDDALLQQINALTPSLNKALRETVTQDGTMTLLPRPGIPDSSSSPSEAVIEDEQMALTGVPEKRSQPKLFRWAVLLVFTGLAIALLMTSSFKGQSSTEVARKQIRAAAQTQTSADSSVTLTSKTGEAASSNQLLIRERQGSFAFTVSGTNARDVAFTVDGIQYKKSDRLPLGKTYLVCSKALGFKHHCQRALLTEQEQILAFKMSPKPKLTPIVRGLVGTYLTTVNDIEETEFPILVLSGQDYRICVTPNAPSVMPKCLRITAEDGHHKPVFKFDSERSVKVSGETFVKEPSQRGATKTARRTSTIKTIPTAEIFLATRRIGTTPFKATKQHFGKTFSLRAKGYVDTQFKLPKVPNSLYRVSLRRPGYLTMRVIPPASQILVDGVEVGTGYLIRLPIAPGSRTVEAIFNTSSGTSDRWGPKTVNITAGKETRLPQILLKRIRSTPND